MIIKEGERLEDAVGMQWKHSGDTVGAQRGCSGNTMGLQWQHNGDAVETQWGCSGDAMAIVPCWPEH